MQECTLLSPENIAATTVLSRRKSLQKSGGRLVNILPVSGLPVSSLGRWGSGWLLDCEMRRHSPQTSTFRRLLLKNLAWLAARDGWTSIGTDELRSFLAYLSRGHLDAGGRWGNPQMVRPVRPITVHTYHGHLKTFFTWLVSERVLSVSPMTTIKAPIVRADQIQPFTTGQIEAMLAVTSEGWQPERDSAIVWLLLDTGIRASELCGLRVGDLDLAEKRIRVTGKGDKSRSVYFGLRSAKALWRYINCGERTKYQNEHTEEEGLTALFPARVGTNRHEALTARGMAQMIERLGQRAGITGVRVSPHTFRHTFAVSFLRAGGQVYALKEILGHTNIKQTLKYVALADADLAGQRRFSPGDRLSGKVTLAGRPANTPRPDKVQTEKPARTEQTVMRKLSEENAKAVKAAALAGEKYKEIAARFGVSVSMVKQIKSGALWGHLS